LDIRIGLSQIGNRAQTGNYSTNEFVEMVEFAITKDITTFDSSPGYGSGEELLAKLPDQIKTKIKVNSKNTPGLTEHTGAEQTLKIRTQLDRTLKILSNIKIDTFFINKPDLNKLSLDVFKELNRYVQNGDIKKIGVVAQSSNRYLDKFLKTINSGNLSELNFLFNIFHYENAAKLEEYRNSGIFISTRSPLSNGIIPFIEQLLNDQENQNISAHKFDEKLIYERLKYSKQLLKTLNFSGSLTDLAFLFVMSQKTVGAVTLGAYRKDHIETFFKTDAQLTKFNSIKELNSLIQKLSLTLKYPVQN